MFRKQLPVIICIAQLLGHTDHADITILLTVSSILRIGHIGIIGVCSYFLLIGTLQKIFGDACGCELFIAQLHYYKSMNLGQ